MKIQSDNRMSNVFEKEATIKQWDDGYYNPISIWLYDEAVADMLKYMDVPPGATVLDAGCGPGVHSIRLAKAGFKVCAVDISDAMLRHAQERANDAGVSEKIEFHQKDLTGLDFADESFDYVFSWGVVIHIREAEKALTELSRIVKPGGKLALYVTNKTALDHKLEAFARLLLRKPIEREELALGIGNWYEVNEEKLWVWQFDAKALAEHLATQGFQLKKRRIGELSEIQLRLKGLPRRIMLRINNLAYRLNLSPRIAHTTLYVFEKKICDNYLCL